VLKDWVVVRVSFPAGAMQLVTQLKAAAEMQQGACVMYAHKLSTVIHQVF